MSSLGYGGTERTVSYLSSFLANHGTDVVILCLTDEVSYEIDPKVKLITANIPTLFRGKLDRIRNIIKRVSKINDVIEVEKPDIVFCIIADSARYFIWRPYLPFKLVVSERSNPKYYSEREKKRIHKIYRRCSGVVFQTERVCMMYPYIEESKKTVIPNAVGNKDAYELHWKTNDSMTFAAIGRLVRGKDYPTLIEAFYRFKKCHKEYKLKIYGDGSLKSEILNLIKDKDLSKSVIILESRPDVLKEIVSAECYILSSEREGMPNTLLEAMGMGMPCIATDCEYGPAELIQNGINGLLVKVGDAQKLCEAMSYIADNKGKASKLGEEAGKILETHNIDSVCSKYLEFLESVSGLESNVSNLRKTDGTHKKGQNIC